MIVSKVTIALLALQSAPEDSVKEDTLVQIKLTSPHRVEVTVSNEYALMPADPAVPPKNTYYYVVVRSRFPWFHRARVGRHLVLKHLSARFTVTEMETLYAERQCYQGAIRCRA